MLNLISNFSNNFQTFNLKYMHYYINKKIKKFPGKQFPFYKLRDSIKYRIESIKFHVHNLKNLSYDGPFIPTKENSDVHKKLLNVSYIGSFLFDDLIFNCVSLIDYVGCMIGYLYFNKMNLKHNGCVNTARDGNLKNNVLAEFIIKENKEWIDSFFGYRSKIIHKRAAYVVPRRTLSFEDSKGNPMLKEKLEIFVPDSFLKEINLFSDKKAKITIDDIIDKLIKKIFEYLIGIIDILLEDRNLYN